MKRHILILLSILVGLLEAYSQMGTWSGSLDVRGTKLPIVFHLDDSHPSLDSPAQHVKGIPMFLARPQADSISIAIPYIGASYNGKCVNDTIAGTFKQSGFTFPLVLTRGEQVVRRPQTPQPPYPYTVEDVSFANGEAVLKGSLTLPEGFSRQTPVAIMITGSGLQNRDEELFEHKPFAVIADALARHGIATLRYDDRGFGDSTGDAANCTTEDLMADALAGINLLRERFDKVGVLGHSEGGTIALMLGADKKADFIVSLAGMVISGKETLVDQNRYALSEAGYPQEVVDEYCAIISAAFDNLESLRPNIEASRLPDALKKNLKAGEQQLATPYFQYFLATDMRAKLPAIACPVLALNGSKDTQVSATKNLDALKTGLPTNAANKIVALEGLNHLFQHCTTGAFAEYATIEETFAPEALEIICRWILSTNK